MDLPTLGLMTSFSLFIYYIAQLTLQLEMEKLGLYGKYPPMPKTPFFS